MGTVAKLNIYLILLCAMPLFSFEPAVDFDGKNADSINVKTFFEENSPGRSNLIPGPISATSSKLIIKREFLLESGEFAELGPVKSWVDENGVRNNQYNVLPSQILRWTLRCQKGKWTARETYNSYPDQVGGHYHYDIPPPPMFVSSASLSSSTAPFHSAPSPIFFSEMKGNTTYYYWEAFPAFATRLVQQFDSYGECQGRTQTDYFNVQVPGLLEMPEGGNYILDNPQDVMGYHPDNHYGLQKLVDTLKSVADQYKAAFPSAESLHINDMSLPWGGGFDIGYDWKPPHFGHTIGSDANLNRAVVPQENRQKLLEILCSLTPGVALEQDLPEDVPHYFLRVYGKPYPESDKFNENERMLVCCKGSVVDPGNLQACVSSLSLFK